MSEYHNRQNRLSFITKKTAFKLRKKSGQNLFTRITNKTVQTKTSILCRPSRPYVRRHVKGPLQTAKMYFLRLETGNEAFVVIFFSLFPVEWASCDACLLGCLT